MTDENNKRQAELDGRLRKKAGRGMWLAIAAVIPTSPAITGGDTP